MAFSKQLKDFIIKFPSASFSKWSRLRDLVVTFGDPDRDEGFGPVAASKILIICHEGDNICDNGIIITAAHRNYEIDAPAAASFIAARVWGCIASKKANNKVNLLP